MTDTVEVKIELTEGVDDEILTSLTNKSQTASNIVSALLRWANDDSVDPNPL
jgi:hypothetical protein